MPARRSGWRRSSPTTCSRASRSVCSPESGLPGGEPDSLRLATRVVETVARLDRAEQAGDALVAVGHILTWSGRIDDARRLLTEHLATVADRDERAAAEAHFYLAWSRLEPGGSISPASTPTGNVRSTSSTRRPSSLTSRPWRYRLPSPRRSRVTTSSRGSWPNAASPTQARAGSTRRRSSSWGSSACWTTGRGTRPAGSRASTLSGRSEIARR